MQKIQVLKEDIGLLGAYNDFIEALAENGINPFRIEQSKRIQMFIEAVSAYNREESSEENEETEVIAVKMDIRIANFLEKIGVVEEMTELIAMAFNSMDTNEQRKIFVQKIKECENPILMMQMIQENIDMSKPEASETIEVLKSIIEKTRNIRMSMMN